MNNSASGSPETRHLNMENSACRCHPVTFPSTPIRRSRNTSRRPGAVDAHCHVFGPEAKFPYAPERKYTPCDAPKEKLFALRDFLGFDKNVIVQARATPRTTAPWSMRSMPSNGRAKGVAFVGEEVTDDELKWMDKAGVRGVRFNFLKRPGRFHPARRACSASPPGSTSSAGISSCISKCRICRSSRTSSPRCPPPSWSTTWARPTVKKGVDDPENLRFHRAAWTSTRISGEGDLPGAHDARRPAL